MEPVTLDRCIVTALDCKPWSVIQCFIKTSLHVSDPRCVTAAGLQQREEVGPLELPRVPRRSFLFKLTESTCSDLEISNAFNYD